MVQETGGYVDIQSVDTDDRHERIVENLKNVYDPEISVNIYDLGLIYNISINNNYCKVLMTLTSAWCPAADEIIEDVRMQTEKVIENVDVDVTFTPQWGPDLMSEDAKLILGID